MGTTLWYVQSQYTYPYSAATGKDGLKVKYNLQSSGYYYCYGYDEIKSQYFLARTKIQVFSKLTLKSVYCKKKKQNKKKQKNN